MLTSTQPKTGLSSLSLRRIKTSTLTRPSQRQARCTYLAMQLLLSLPPCRGLMVKEILAWTLPRLYHLLPANSIIQAGMIECSKYMSQLHPVQCLCVSCQVLPRQTLKRTLANLKTSFLTNDRLDLLSNQMLSFSFTDFTNSQGCLRS